MSTPSRHWFILTPHDSGHWTFATPEGVVLASVKAPHHQTFRVWLVAGLSLVLTVATTIGVVYVVNVIAPQHVGIAGLVGFFAGMYGFAIVGMRLTDEPVLVSRSAPNPILTLQAPRAMTLQSELDVADTRTDSLVGKVVGQELQRGGEVVASYAHTAERPLPEDVVKALHLSSDRLGAECIDVAAADGAILFQLRRPAPLLGNALIFGAPEVFEDDLLLAYALYLTAVVPPRPLIRI